VRDPLSADGREWKKKKRTKKLLVARSVYQGQVRTARKEDSFSVNAQCINNRIMTAEIMHECPIGAFPFLNIISTCRAGRKGVFGRVDGQRADGLLMMGQCHRSFASGKIPESEKEERNLIITN
jgi:hypothetical protein